MTYRAGIGPLLAQRLNTFESHEPTLMCDECGFCIIVKPVRGGMPAWLAEGKAPKGWKMLTISLTDANNAVTSVKKHFCPKCKDGA